MFNFGGYNRIRYNSRPVPAIVPPTPAVTTPPGFDLPWNPIGQYAPDLSDKMPWSNTDLLEIQLLRAMAASELDKIGPQRNMNMPFF